MKHKPIFICDDEQEILRYLKKLFELQGMKVETFSNGKAVLSRLQDPQSPPPRLLLQDVHLGEENGIDIARQARELNPSLPVIVMTAYGSPMTEDLAIEAGAKGFLAKPFGKEKLLEMVKAI